MNNGLNGKPKTHNQKELLMIFDQNLITKNQEGLFWKFGL